MSRKIMGWHIVELVSSVNKLPGVKQCEEQAKTYGYHTAAFHCAVMDWWEGSWDRSEYRDKRCDLPSHLMSRSSMMKDASIGRKERGNSTPRLSRYEISKISGVSLTKIMTEQGCLCACCGGDLITSGDYALDHIFPVAKGGMNMWWNLQFLCRRCNSEKSAKDPFEWAEQNGVKLPLKFTSRFDRSGM